MCCLGQGQHKRRLCEHRNAIADGTYQLRHDEGGDVAIIKERASSFDAVLSIILPAASDVNAINSDSHRLPQEAKLPVDINRQCRRRDQTLVKRQIKIYG